MKIAVIGGGASGMMAAITAAKNGAEVTLYERNDRVGKKILVTGNGKCNFSNIYMEPSYFHSENVQRAWDIIKQFDAVAVRAFFADAGMLSKEKNGGLYPVSGQASTVLDILRSQLSFYHVKIKTEQYVKDLIPNPKSGSVTVITKTDRKEFDSVIVTCGGLAAPKTGSDGSGFMLAQKLGHQIIPTVPALVQLIGAESYFKAVSGVRCDAALKLIIDGKEAGAESGELQFTDYGISGIVVFQLSRTAAYALKNKKNVEIYIDCLADYDEKAYSEYILSRKCMLKNADTVESFFTGMLNKKLMFLFMKLAGLKPTDAYKSADPKKIDKVFSLCRCFKVKIAATNSFENAQVTAGGISFTDVTNTLESKKIKNLYFAGEIMDVDGACGGYNLQWAWSSGYVAGREAAKKQTVDT